MKIPIVFLSFILFFHFHQLAESEKIIKCYSCLGLDLDNCMHGESYCNGVCWKLIDRDHGIVAKGCSKQKHELTGEEGDFQTGIQLYWAHKEELKGSAVFCNHDYCNSAVKIDSKILHIMILALLFRFIFSFVA